MTERKTIMKEKCCNKLMRERSEQEYKDLVHRLNRIEGQVRGIRKMVEENIYCVDILTQSAAVRAAIDSFNKKLIETHIKTCVCEDIRQGNNEKTDELIDILKKLMR
jgi:DNA-binding FrmR family transcriptional regulator